MVSLKLRCGDDIRRISVEKTISFKELVGQIRTIFGAVAEEDVVIKYLDDEGDKVTLSSDVELREALQCCKEPIQLFISKCPHGTNVSAEPVLETMDFSMSQLLGVKLQTPEGKNKTEEEGLIQAKLALEAKRKEEEEARKMQAEQRRMQELARLLEQKREQEIKQRQIEESKLREMKRVEERMRLEEERRREEEEQRRRVEEERRRVEEEQRRIEEQRRAEEEQRRMEEERRRVEEEQRRIEEQRRMEEERRRLEERIFEEELKRAEEERRRMEEERTRIEEEQRRLKEKREEERRKAAEQKTPSPKPISSKVEAAWVEYKARNGRNVLLDLSSAATARFGVKTYQRVNTPAGQGTVIGVDQEHGFLWFQLDKDMKEGVSYWDDILNYDSMVCKGIQPLSETALQHSIPLPRATEALLSAIANPTEKEMMLQAIQQSLLDQQQQEIKQFYQSIQDAKKM